MQQRRRQSEISASSNGRGTAGQIAVQATERIQLSRGSEINSAVRENAITTSSPERSITQIFAATNQTPQILLETPQLQLNNGSRITANTAGRGDAGDIRVQRAQAVQLSNRSSISTGVNGRRAEGQGGTITVQTENLNLAGDRSEISASTIGRGAAGSVAIDAANVTLQQGGQLETSSASDRQAGSITVNARDRVRLNGEQTGIFASTTRAGRGGNITVSTPTLELTNQAQINARSNGTGEAGAIAVTSEAINMENADIATAARQASGGDITINADPGQMRLRGDSDIRTEVAQGGGQGGSIVIRAGNVIAFDDSDIVTRAPAGQGGNITFETPAFFGEGYQPGSSADPDPNGRVDVDASGLQSGVVQAPDVSFIENSLVELPDAAIATDTLLANSCIARSESGSTFLVTGTGGLPQRPGDSALPAYATGEVRSLPSEPQSWQSGDAIVEPQGVYRLADGQLVMSRECGE